MSPAPAVTIGLPVYNGERYLVAALASLQAQDFPDIEIIVGDNGSTDRTAEIIRTAAGGDARVRYVGSAVNRGAAWNFNRLVALARAPFFKWAAHDDRCAPTFVRLCHEALADAPPSVVLAYPGTSVINEQDEVVGDFEDGLHLREDAPHARLSHLLRSRTEYHPVFGLIRTDALRTTRLIAPFVASDIALLAELALRGQWREVPDRLFLRRFHPQTSMNANPDPTDRAAWFDPSRRLRVALPATRLGWEILDRVGRAGLAGPERTRCYAVVARDFGWAQRRVIAGEGKAAVLRLAREAPGPRKERPAGSPFAGRPSTTSERSNGSTSAGGWLAGGPGTIASSGR